jgi:large repetitive protein
LSLPAGATVLFVGLYYGAVTVAGTGGASANALRNQVKLKVPGASSYRTLTAPVLDISSADQWALSGLRRRDESARFCGERHLLGGSCAGGDGVDRYGGWAIDGLADGGVHEDDAG